MNEAVRDATTVTGARLLVDQLRLHGVERIFCVPGESFMAVLDELYDTPEIKGKRPVFLSITHNSGLLEGGSPSAKS
jgi:hypothetical protein